MEENIGDVLDRCDRYEQPAGSGVKVDWVDRGAPTMVGYFVGRCRVALVIGVGPQSGIVLEGRDALEVRERGHFTATHAQVKATLDGAERWVWAEPTEGLLAVCWIREGAVVAWGRFRYSQPDWSGHHVFSPEDRGPRFQFHMQAAWELRDCGQPREPERLGLEATGELLDECSRVTATTEAGETTVVWFRDGVEIAEGEYGAELDDARVARLVPWLAFEFEGPEARRLIDRGRKPDVPDTSPNKTDV